MTKSRAVIELGKRFFYKQLELDLPSAYRYKHFKKITIFLYFFKKREGAELMAENLTLSDGQEGLKSFVEKRKPVWKHDTN